MNLRTRLLIWLVGGLPLLIEWLAPRNAPEGPAGPPGQVTHSHEWNEPPDEPPLQLVHAHSYGDAIHEHPAEELAALASATRGQ